MQSDTNTNNNEEATLTMPDKNWGWCSKICAQPKRFRNSLQTAAASTLQVAYVNILAKKDCVGIFMFKNSRLEACESNVRFLSPTQSKKCLKVVQSFQDRLGQALHANSTFELCAGKKVSVSTKRRYKVHSSRPEGKLHFSAMMTSPEMSRDKWIIGGQDSCHVCQALFSKRFTFLKFQFFTNSHF